jgi:hypothetical protein
VSAPGDVSDDGFLLLGRVFFTESPPRSSELMAQRDRSIAAVAVTAPALRAAGTDSASSSSSDGWGGARAVDLCDWEPQDVNVESL